MRGFFYKAIKKVYFIVVPKLGYTLAGKVNTTMILFDSPIYGDNAKVLSDYVSQNKKYKIIYLTDNKKNINKSNNIKLLNRSFWASKNQQHIYTFRAYYYAAKAKYVFYTHSFNWPRKKHKSEQKIINLWHGSGYKASVPQKDADTFDKMLVPGEIFIRSKAEFFNCEEEKIIPLGYPRYDIFKSDTKAKFENFIKNLELKGRKIITWLPTFIEDSALFLYKKDRKSVV